MADHRAKQTIFPVALRAESITVLDARPPAGNRPFPRAQHVVDSNIIPEDLSAPAIMIAPDPENRHRVVGESRERGENAISCSRDHTPPLEPEIEEVSVDHEGPGAASNVIEKSQEGRFGFVRIHSKVVVGNHITW